MHTTLQDTNREWRAAFGSPRDYAIYTGWVNGASKAATAREFGLSPTRVGQIIGRFNRRYDSGVGRSFYVLIDRMLSTRPILYSVLQPSLGELVLACSVVVPSVDYLFDKTFCRSLAVELSAGELPWAIRRPGTARIAIGYLSSLLEEV